MSCRAVLEADRSATDGILPSAAGEAEYLLERPRLMLAMLDLMEKFERKSSGIDREEVSHYAP